MRQFIRQELKSSIADVRNRENVLGSSATGSDGDKDRTITLTETKNLTIQEVYLDGLLLTETIQYTINNTTKVISFVDTYVFNSQLISIFYST